VVKIPNQQTILAAKSHKKRKRKTNKTNQTNQTDLTEGNGAIRSSERSDISQNQTISSHVPSEATFCHFTNYHVCELASGLTFKNILHPSKPIRENSCNSWLKSSSLLTLQGSAFPQHNGPRDKIVKRPPFPVRKQNNKLTPQPRLLYN
jgi:hypothetical protein